MIFEEKSCYQSLKHVNNFYQEKERNNFLNNKTLVIQKDNEQIKCKIQLNLKKKFYFIKGVPINYTPSQIKDPT